MVTFVPPDPEPDVGDSALTAGAWAMAGPFGPSKVVLLPLTVTAGVGLPDAASWFAENFASGVIPPDVVTHRPPEVSKARPSAPFKPALEIVTVGVGLPEVEIWFGVYSTTVPLPKFATQRSPCGSKVGKVGETSPDPESVTTGVGVPPAASWAGVNPKTVFPLR